MKHATSVCLLFLCILNRSPISGSEPKDCDKSEKWRKFVHRCYNDPKKHHKLEITDDQCTSYIVCKDKKLSDIHCEIKDGKLQYFQNGKCTTERPSSCKPGCYDSRYERFLEECTYTDNFILNDLDNCESGYLCKDSTLSLIDCNKTMEEDRKKHKKDGIWKKDSVTNACRYRKYCVPRVA